VLVLTGLALALGGCGGDDDSGSDEAADTVDSAAAVELDAQAKAAARERVAVVESCFVDRQDYSRCVGSPGLDPTPETTAEAPSAAEFVVVAPSKSGNEFRVTRTPGGALERTCEEPGTGGCAAGGSW
jgi:hypothetical protein